MKKLLLCFYIYMCIMSHSTIYTVSRPQFVTCAWQEKQSSSICQRGKTLKKSGKTNKISFSQVLFLLPLHSIHILYVSATWFIFMKISIFSLKTFQQSDIKRILSSWSNYSFGFIEDFLFLKIDFCKVDISRFLVVFLDFCGWNCNIYCLLSSFGKKILGTFKTRLT